MTEFTTREKNLTFLNKMPQKLSEAFRLPITEAGNIRSSGLDNQSAWRYTGAGPVGSNASAGAMNYQAMGPMNAAPYLSAGAAQHRPVTGYAQPGVPANNAWQQLTGSTASPEFSNTLLFIALAVFFLYLLDMIVKSARSL